MTDVIIIGGGASGLMAAASAVYCGKSVTLSKNYLIIFLIIRDFYIVLLITFLTTILLIFSNLMVYHLKLKEVTEYFLLLIDRLIY